MRRVLLITAVMLFLAPALARAAELEPALRDAQKAIKDNKLEDALKYLVDAQIDFPHDSLLSYHLGEVYYKMERYQEAEEAFKRAMRTDDKIRQADSLYNLGNTAFKAGKLKEAIEYFSQALDRRPDDDDTKYNLDVAREVLRRLIEEQKKRQEEQKEQQENQENQQCNNHSPSEDGQSGSQNKEESAQDNDAASDAGSAGAEPKEEEQQEQQEEQDQQEGQEQQQGEQQQEGQEQEQDKDSAGENGEQNSASESKAAPGQPAGEEEENGAGISRLEAEQALKRLEEQPNMPKVSGKRHRPAKDW